MEGHAPSWPRSPRTVFLSFAGFCLGTHCLAGSSSMTTTNRCPNPRAPATARRRRQFQAWRPRTISGHEIMRRTHAECRIVPSSSALPRNVKQLALPRNLATPGPSPCCPAAEENPKRAAVFFVAPGAAVQGAVRLVVFGDRCFIIRVLPALSYERGLAPWRLGSESLAVG